MSSTSPASLSNRSLPPPSAHPAPTLPLCCAHTSSPSTDQVPPGPFRTRSSRSPNPNYRSEHAHGTMSAQTRRGQVGQRFESRSEEHTSELQSRGHLVCRLLL